MRNTVNPDADLTEREVVVLNLLAKGFRTPEIASQLGRSRHTVHDNLQSIYVKLGASTQAEAVYRALKEGRIQ